jgi:hypothetical protein
MQTPPEVNTGDPRSLPAVFVNVAAFADIEPERLAT